MMARAPPQDHWRPHHYYNGSKVDIRASNINFQGTPDQLRNPPSNVDIDNCNINFTMIITAACISPLRHAATVAAPILPLVRFNRSSLVRTAGPLNLQSGRRFRSFCHSVGWADPGNALLHSQQSPE
jgi:hypothetical protein